MTYRHVCNQTSRFTREHCVDVTLETQKSLLARPQNSPFNVNFDGNEQVVFKAREFRPCGVEQSDNLAVWVSDIPDFDLIQNEAMDAYDVSQHCVGAGITYTAIVLPTGLSLSTDGILSGTPTNTGEADPLVTATNAGGDADSNIFNISVTTP
jgi:hypothetical protein